MPELYLLRGGELHREPFEVYFKDLPRVTALVGGGGKTTLMYALASLSQSRGRRTAVTTTTHIARPKDDSLCHSLSRCRERWESGEYAVWAEDLHNGKLGPLSADDFDLALRESDALLAEADGSRHMSCKVPADHEPCIPEQAELVIGVLGLSVLGRTIAESCFRPEDVSTFLGCGQDRRLTPEDLANILSSYRGTRKNVGRRPYLAVLNQCDGPGRLERGAEILRILESGGIRAVMTCLLPRTGEESG